MSKDGDVPRGGAATARVSSAHTEPPVEIRRAALVPLHGLAGPIGLVWSERGIHFLNLPEPTEAITRARVASHFPEASWAPPDDLVRTWIARLDRMLAEPTAAPDDLHDLPLVLDGVPDFNKRAYDLARRIPPGETLTYGEIAQRLGSPGAARAVGQAMGKNPIPIIVPCHRVLAAGGKMGGFSGAGGVVTKRVLLALERRESPLGPLFAQGPRLPVLVGVDPGRKRARTARGRRSARRVHREPAR